MNAIVIRSAKETDAREVRRIVEAAYEGYIPAIGRRPGPMDDDYVKRIADGEVWVLEQCGSVAGVLVLIETPERFLLDNIAVDPGRKGTGLGRALLLFAEQEAIRRGWNRIELYTNAAMTGNISLYTRIGYQETGRARDHGFDRVFMTKTFTATS
jgi:GNAT superfamily N-acetyltransferase